MPKPLTGQEMAGSKAGFSGLTTLFSVHGKVLIVYCAEGSVTDVEIARYRDLQNLQGNKGARSGENSCCHQLIHSGMYKTKN